MAGAKLFLNSEGCGGGSEDDAVDLPFRQRDLEEPEMRGFVGLRSESLPLLEGLELFLG